MVPFACRARCGGCCEGTEDCIAFVLFELSDLVRLLLREEDGDGDLPEFRRKLREFSRPPPPLALTWLFFTGVMGGSSMIVGGTTDLEEEEEG